MAASDVQSSWAALCHPPASVFYRKMSIFIIYFNALMAKCSTWSISNILL